jgi:hypothetical protein
MTEDIMAVIRACSYYNESFIESYCLQESYQTKGSTW